ncbi:hypothetical protein RND71_017642 [Anisodus tanguticus]|uniref:Uncharacterized protein n=1 Tax=Anisodus tanguticus TaxID=243964 RepID=A0AAE1S2P6_9SOLA|nr:hypothetical protein RND71_017642 [Anisodus tanguticus]
MEDFLSPSHMSTILLDTIMYFCVYICTIAASLSLHEPKAITRSIIDELQKKARSIKGSHENNKQHKEKGEEEFKNR